MSHQSQPNKFASTPDSSAQMIAARLRTILASEPECVKTVNPNGDVIDMNPAGMNMIGVTDVREVRGRNLSQMVDARDWPTYQKNMTSVFQGETLTWQFRCKTEGSEPRWMEQTAAPIFSTNDSETVVEMVAITRDITEKKKTEASLLAAKEKAERANAAKTNFLANMSHEIRTPMNAILGMVNMLTETSLNDEQQERLSVIQESGESLLRILNDVLDLSKVEAGRIDLEESSFRVTDQIEKLHRLHSANAAKKNLSLELTGCEHMAAERSGDPVRILQILNNLIDNAIKFTPSGSVSGTFTCGNCCSSEKQDSAADSVHIVITDTGIGMTETQTDKVFAPFKQADASMTRRYGGTGLGLTIAKELTELMSGSIKVKSEVDQGTSFEITLELPPVQQECQTEPTTPPEKEVAFIEDNEKRTLQILAVEDGDVNRLVLSHILKKINADVVMTSDGKQAIEAFENGIFDLILMDIHMPVMDGIAAAAEIRKIEKKRGSKETAIVAVTASVTDMEVNQYKAFGFCNCIAKPINPERIREVINAVRS